MSAGRSAGTRPAAARVGVAGTVGLVVAVAMGVTTGWEYAPPSGWTAAAAIFVGRTWAVIGRMTPEETVSHATREDPTAAMTGVIVLAASVASLAGLVYLLAAASNGSEVTAAMTAGLGIVSVVAAWVVVHTLYTLEYARLYYSDKPGGIDFNQPERPGYVDFAYLAFTLGMTYQVSDTDLQTRPIRATALRHALLSYLLGAVVLAAVVNLVAGLGTNGGGH
jgi:uncharacterized membrane protein